MNPIKVPSNKIMLDKERSLKFTWASIDYLNDRYENGFDDAIALMCGDGKSSLSKKKLEATFDIMFALLMHEDKELTVEKLKEIMPIELLIAISATIIKVIRDGALIANPPLIQETPVV